MATIAAQLRMARFRGAADGEGLLGAGRGRRWTGRSRGSGIVGMLPERHIRLRMIRRFVESGINAPQKPHLWKLGGLSHSGGGFCFGLFERCPERGMRA